MARKPTPTQQEATQPRLVDPIGRTLDQWGLPLSGPARVAARGDRTDPAIDPAGWDTITEAVARENGYVGDMRALPKARALDIYKRLYWDRPGLEGIAAIDADIAVECFDTGVNMGTSISIRFLQRVLNALNRQGRDYHDLAVDGAAGRSTQSALRALINLRGMAGRQAVLSYLNALQGARYVELAEGRAPNEDFIMGWALRLEPLATGLKA